MPQSIFLRCLSHKSHAGVQRGKVNQGNVVPHFMRNYLYERFMQIDANISAARTSKAHTQDRNTSKCYALAETKSSRVGGTCHSPRRSTGHGLGHQLQT